MKNPSVCDAVISATDFEKPGVRLAERIVENRLPNIGFVDLLLTERCNHRCDYCFIKKKEHSATMSEEVAKASIDFLLNNLGTRDGLQILLFGGEPFIEFDLIKMIVSYGKQRTARMDKKIGFHTTSNGTLCTDEVCGFCRDNDIRILLSIDGDKQSHDLNRHLLGGGSSFDTVMSRLPTLKKHQPWLGTRMTVTPLTVGNIRHNVAYLFAEGINQFIIGPATGLRWKFEDLQMFEEQMYLVAELYSELKSKKAPFRMTLFETDLDSPKGHLRGKWGCGAGRGRICISTTGELYGCAKILGVSAMRETHKLGDIWSGFTNLKTRLSLLNQSAHLRPKCTSCKHADECGGGCPATNYEATGSIYYPAQLDCDMIPIVERIKLNLKSVRKSSDHKVVDERRRGLDKEQKYDI